MATGVTPVTYSYEELSDHPPDVYSLKRKRKSKSSGDKPFGTGRPTTKVAITYEILRDTMGPEAKVVSSKTSRIFEVTTPQTRPRGKSSTTETPFNFVSCDIAISSISLQPIPPSSPSIPFGTITTPIPKQQNVYVIISIPIQIIAESTITTTIPIISETTTTTALVTTTINLRQTLLS